MPDHSINSDGWAQNWSQTPFYTVGPASASLLASLAGGSGSQPSPARASLCPCDIRGAESGNAEQLARFILRDLDQAEPQTLLYLTGDKNRDTLSSIIQGEEGGLATLKSEQVYATAGVNLETFERHLLHALKGLHSACKHN